MIPLKVKIKKGDEVIVIAGKSKSARGKVLAVERGKDERVRVKIEGVHKVKKAVRPNPQKGEPGGLKDQEAFIDISNVQLFNPASNRGERVGYKILEDGRKVRYFKSTGESVNTDQI